jgi:hypothetical protein
MTGYAFKDRDKAVELSMFADYLIGDKTEDRHPTGMETMIAVCDEAVAALDTTDPANPEAQGPFDGTRSKFGKDNLTVREDASTGSTVKFYNLSASAYAQNDVVQLVRWRTMWIIPPVKAPEAGVSIQFRLKSGWNDSATGGTNEGCGVSTAIALTTSGGIAAGSEMTVYDFKKLFQNAVGSDEQTDPVGGSIGWANKVGSVWIVEECTQKINRYEATVANGLCSGNWGESISVTNLIARSVWPYTDPDPAVSGTGTVNAINLHGLAANGGQVWIEFQQDPTATQDPSNSTVPYDSGISPTDGKWVITDVEKPVANYIQCMWNGTAWDFSQGDNVYDGIEPDAQFNVVINHPDHLNLLGETSGSPCLETGTKGLARIDRSASSGSQLKYFVCMTSSSLNGEVYEAAIAGTLSPSLSQPPVNEDIIVVDGCEVQYKRIGKAFIFGSPNAVGPCELSEQTVSEPFLNWEDLDVMGGTNLLGGTLTFERYSIKSCTKEETTPLVLERRNVTIVEDIYCSSSGEFVKDTKDIQVIALSSDPDVIGTPIDTSCIQVYHENIIYPDYPYIDYYDIIYPDGCNPCDEEGGCCLLELTGGAADEQIENTSEAYCRSQYETRDDVTSWAWNSGGCVGCCSMGLYGTGYHTYDYVSKSVCDSRDNVGYIDPASGEVITNTNWSTQCPAVGCCEGGAANGLYTDQTSCVSGGGVWNEGVACPTGCCVAPGEPVDGIVVTEKVCDDYSGTWYENQLCNGNTFGCCVVYNSSSEEVAQEEGLTNAECINLANTVPAGNSYLWYEGEGCIDATGCCVGGTYDGMQVLEGICNGAGGTGWTQGPCSGGGGDEECDGNEVNSFYISAGGGSCTATFTQTVTATISGGSATVTGTWDLYDGVLPQIGVAGTVILTKSGTNWLVSADIDGTINTTVTGTVAGASPDMCAEGASGTVSGPAGDSPCNGTWSGIFTFSLTA